MKLKIDAPKTRQNRNNKTVYRSHITVPYDEGLSETIKTLAKNMPYKFISKVARP